MMSFLFNDVMGSEAQVFEHLGFAHFTGEMGKEARAEDHGPGILGKQDNFISTLVSFNS
jgi:hypothetical protein